MKGAPEEGAALAGKRLSGDSTGLHDGAGHEESPQEQIDEKEPADKDSDAVFPTLHHRRPGGQLPASYPFVEEPLQESTIRSDLTKFLVDVL